MQLAMRVDARQVTQAFQGLEAQMPYILSRTINNTLVQAQTAEVAHIHKAFTVRRPAFVKNSIKMVQFANKQTLTGILAVADLGGKSTADLLAKFETGGRKTSDRGGKVAVPTQIVRTSKSGVISAAKRPRNLRNAFKVTTKKGKELILQRKGRGKHETVQVAYVLEQSVPIDSRLTFNTTVAQSVQQNLERNFQESFRYAIQTAR